MSRTIYIKSQTRPIRFVYLVRNVAEFTAAVKFYTHSWGGAGNLILPLPKTRYQAGLFKYALYECSPDLIIYADDDIPEVALKVLNSITAPRIKIGAPEFVERFVNNQRRVFYQNRQIPHMVDVLGLHGINREEVLCPDDNVDVEHGLSIQTGIPSSVYLETIKKENTVSHLQVASSYEDYLKASIIVAASNTARSLTLKGLTASWGDHGLGLDSDDFLYLYLYKRSDINVWSTYWNQSNYFTKNKLLLPRDGFFGYLDNSASIISSISKKFECVRLILNATRDGAAQIQEAVYNAFNAAAGRKIDVDVIFDGDVYNIEPIHLAWKKPNYLSVAINNSMLKFDPLTPKNFDATPLAYAFDVELTTETGLRVGLPNTIIGSRILTFGVQRIEEFDHNYSALERIIHYPHVRSTHRGISAVASSQLRDESLADASFFLPTDDEAARSYARQAGYLLVPNQAAHYARAFLRRIGFAGNRSKSFDELDVASCVIGAKYESITCTLKQIIDRFIEMKNIQRTEAQSIINSALPRLLRSGLIRRGYSVKCEHCMYTDWYPIDEIGETIKCLGCGERTITPLQTVFEYRLTELTRKFFQGGGRAVVNTLWLFSQRSVPGVIAIGGELIPIGKKKSVVDVDVILLTVDEVAVVECKDWKSIREQGRPKFKESIQKMITAATMLEADSAYMSIYTNDPPEKIIKYIKPFYRNARAKGIALCLIVNDKLFEFRIVKGKVDVNEFELKTSVIYRQVERRDGIVGKRYRDHGYSGFDAFYEMSALNVLKSNILVTNPE